jgi:hypothetical protein
MRAGTDRPQAGGDRRGFFRRDGRWDRRSFYHPGREPASRKSALRSDDEDESAAIRTAKRAGSRKAPVGLWTIDSRPHSTL